MDKYVKLKDAVAQVIDDRVYVGFELTKLASEKGYDIFCNMSWTHYLKTTKYYKKNTYGFDSITGSNAIHKTFNCDYYSTYSAPLQSSLQRWLRTEHNIVVLVSYLPNNKQWNWEIDYTSNLDDRITSGMFKMRIKPKAKFDFSTYEEALEYGLLEAINNIK